MQKLQPQLKAINDKYKNIKINDPRKAEQNQEVMALYKKEGVNPVGGCLPMFIQLPFLYAFYNVLSISIELRHAPWLWVSDLSTPGNLTDPPAADRDDHHSILDAEDDAGGGCGPQSAEDDDVHAADFRVYVSIIFPSGLVLYYLTGNLVGIVFQLVVNRFMPVPTPPPTPPAKAPG